MGLASNQFVYIWWSENIFKGMIFPEQLVFISVYWILLIDDLIIKSSEDFYWYLWNKSYFLSLTVHSHFITEKKPSLPLDSVIQKLADSYRSCIAPGMYYTVYNLIFMGDIFLLIFMNLPTWNVNCLASISKELFSLMLPVDTHLVWNSDGYF